MRRPLGALVVTLALAGTAAGCGGDDVVGDVVPRSTPELTAPKDADLGSGASTTTTGTTTTDATTPTTPATGAAPSTPATPAPSTPPTGGAAPQTGDGTPGGTAPETGGASPGAFSEFCRQNPGACPDQ